MRTLSRAEGACGLAFTGGVAPVPREKLELDKKPGVLYTRSLCIALLVRLDYKQLMKEKRRV